MKETSECSYIRYIDADSCTGCAACVAVCGTGAIQYVDDRAIVAYPERCDGDGLCRKACPADAIH